MPLPGALIQQPMLDPKTGLITRPWLLYLNSLAASSGGGPAAPADATYVTASANAVLTAERVATSSTSVLVDTSVSGQMDWQRAALTGDITASQDSNATALTATGVSASTYGDATHVGRFTVDAKGRLTAASNVAITATGTVTTTGSPASGNLTKFSGATSITNADLTGDVTTTGTVATTLAASGVSAGTYGDSTHVSQVTVDAKGRVTAASNVAIATGGTVTHTGTLTANELIVGNGGVDIKAVAATDGQIPIGKTSDGSVNLATLTAGTNITVTNGAGSVTIAAIGGSGGTGNSTYTGAEGSEPGGINAGDVYFPNNGFYLRRYSGSIWAPWGPIFPMTEPISGDFAWINQGGASIDTTFGGVYLLAPLGAGDNLRIRKKAAPATPYTITIGFLCELPPFNFANVGLCFRESGSGKLATCAVLYDNTAITGGYGVTVDKFTSPTVFSANYTKIGNQPPGTVWLQISDTGANRISRWSVDGQHWYQIHTVGRTDFLTADEVGFFANSNNANREAAMGLLSWVQS